MISDLDIYLFDLRGYLLIEQALSRAEVDALNAGINAILPLKRGEWAGYVHGHAFSDNDGINLQQIYEGGEPFERLIDHPSWIDKVKHFVGGEGTFDYHPSPLFIDENFANIRSSGGAIGLHSGGHDGTKRTQFRYYNGRFQCGQINILMALSDIGPGDGATMVIPGSHKAHFVHPELDEHAIGSKKQSVDNVTGAVEVHMKAAEVDEKVVEQLRALGYVE